MVLSATLIAAVTTSAMGSFQFVSRSSVYRSVGYYAQYTGPFPGGTWTTSAQWNFDGSYTSFGNWGGSGNPNGWYWTVATDTHVAFISYAESYSRIGNWYQSVTSDFASFEYVFDITSDTRVVGFGYGAELRRSDGWTHSFPGEIFGGGEEIVLTAGRYTVQDTLINGLGSSHFELIVVPAPGAMAAATIGMFLLTLRRRR